MSGHDLPPFLHDPAAWRSVRAAAPRGPHRHRRVTVQVRTRDAGGRIQLVRDPHTGGWVLPGAAVPAHASPLGALPDGLLAAVEAGATAVIQPGGSIRDDEVIAAADEAGLAMIFTGMRHFRH